MNLHVHSTGLNAHPSLREHLERRLAFALGRFGEEISRIRVRLADTNGPRGGVDKEVRVRVQGRRLGLLVVTDRDASLLAAIDRAAERAGNAVARSLERARTLRRR